MLRTIVAAIAAICTIGLVGAPAAAAGPKFCENHGTGAGQMYKTACAGGDGGLGPMMGYEDPSDGKMHFVRTSDWDKKRGH